MKSIIVRGANWIGDAVMTIPALRELRRLFPAAKITLHTRGWAEGIFCEQDFIDEILTIDNNATVFGQAKILRKSEFDLAVLFTNSFQSAFVPKLAKIEKRFGYANEGRSFLLTNAVKKPVWKNEKHEVFYYLNLIGEIEKSFFKTETILQNQPLFDLQISEKRREQARKILAKNSIDLTKITIALGVGSTNSRAKRWSAGNYAELNDKLQNSLNANVVLVGAKDEIDVSREVYKKSEFKPTILTGETSLSEAAAILCEIDLLISNDMGLAHVSSAIGTKTLVIFGPTNPKTTKPWNAEIVRRETVECSPCMLRDCPIDHRCMDWISADEVFEKSKKLLENI